jgi:hypothetical protein
LTFDPYNSTATAGWFADRVVLAADAQSRFAATIA